MLFRISSGFIKLFKKDRNGIPNYKHVKDHIVENKHAVAGIVTSLFLFILLINVTIISSSRLDRIRSLIIEKTTLSLKVVQLEDDVFEANAKYSVLYKRYMAIKTDVVEKKPPDRKRNLPSSKKNAITREVVIDQLSFIKD